MAKGYMLSAEYLDVLADLVRWWRGNRYELRIRRHPIRRPLAHQISRFELLEDLEPGGKAKAVRLAPDGDGGWEDAAPEHEVVVRDATGYAAGVGRIKAESPSEEDTPGTIVQAYKSHDHPDWEVLSAQGSNAVPWKNEGSETAPAYGVLRISGSEGEGDGTLLLGTDASPSARDVYAVNTGSPVAQGATGYCWPTGSIAWVLYDPTVWPSESPAVGRYVAPMSTRKWKTGLRDGGQGWPVLSAPLADPDRILVYIAPMVPHVVLHRNTLFTVTSAGHTFVFQHAWPRFGFTVSGLTGTDGTVATAALTGLYAIHLSVSAYSANPLSAITNATDTLRVKLQRNGSDPSGYDFFPKVTDIPLHSLRDYGDSVVNLRDSGQFTAMALVEAGDELSLHVGDGWTSSHDCTIRECTMTIIRVR